MSDLRRLVFQSHIDASPERVFAFHELTDAFRPLTPGHALAPSPRAC